VRGRLLAVVLFLVAAGAGLLFLRGGLTRRSGAGLSPARHPGIAIAHESGATRVWLESDDGRSRRLVTSLGPNESARNVSWSPDGRLAAFESFNDAGHSPMTTTHVWVVEADSAGIREVRLPPPNERFSTYLDRWVDKDTLRIRTTLLERPEDVFFLYRHRAGEIQGPVG